MTLTSNCSKCQKLQNSNPETHLPKYFQAAASKMLVFVLLLVRYMCLVAVPKAAAATVFTLLRQNKLTLLSQLPAHAFFFDCLLQVRLFCHIGIFFMCTRKFYLLLMQRFFSPLFHLLIKPNIASESLLLLDCAHLLKPPQ